jgi:hypothetical protein
VVVALLARQASNSSCVAVLRACVALLWLIYQMCHRLRLLDVGPVEVDLSDVQEGQVQYGHAANIHS